MKVIVLDLDGTLYEKRSVVKEVLKEFSKRKKCELSKIEKEYKKAYDLVRKDGKKYSSIKKLFSEVDKVFLKNLGFEVNNKNIKELEELADEAKIKVLLEVDPRPYVRSFLKNVKDKGLKTVVFSGSHEIHKQIKLETEKESFSEKLDFKVQQLENLKIKDLIDEIIPTTRFGGYKPDLSVFRKLVEHLECDPTECIMIGDSDNDMAAKEIGMKTIFIGKSKNFNWEPHYITNSFEEIDRVVRSMC